MTSQPDLFIEELVKAGADIISVHAESAVHLHRTLNYIKSCGAKAAVALNPATPISVLESCAHPIGYGPDHERKPRF